MECGIGQGRLTGLRQNDFELFEFDVRPIPLLESRDMLELINDRIKWTVDMVRRPLVAASCVRLLRDALHEGLADARLADPGVPAQERDLPFAELGLFP